MRHHGRRDESKSRGILDLSDILIKTNPASLIDDPLLVNRHGVENILFVTKSEHYFDSKISKYFLVGIITVGDHFYTTQVKQINGIGEMTTNGVTLSAQQQFTDLATNFEVKISIYW